MSSLLLFRHGQAGSRDAYDALSQLGHRQTALLGSHLASQRMPVSAFFVGALRRQQETAANIARAFAAQGLPLPEPIVDPRWNEFDLDAVYEGIAPQLAAGNPEFGAHYNAMRKEAANPDSTVHRRWTMADIEVVRAWIDGRYTYDGESWIEFQQRVAGAFDSLRCFAPTDVVMVSTSATPIAVWMGLALGLTNRYIMRTAGALYNASITTFRIREGEPHLAGFNHVPHLDQPELRTFR
ncbi:MAG: histidine phosphatase family protein [Bryobacterales bacterium]|nr:histidine phosphatase family protein [Bryobacterales bacterium]